MELINKDTPQVKEFISSLDSMLNGIVLYNTISPT